MATKLIGIREFRAHIADYAKKARKGTTRFIIMDRNRPLFEMKPFAEDTELESIFADILAAKDDVAKGRLYSQEDILAEFG